MAPNSNKKIFHNKESHLVPTRFGYAYKAFMLPKTNVRLRDLFKTIVTVTVGPNAYPFSVHKEILSTVSPFFAAALNPSYGFKESTASTCHLPEARVEDFKYFVQWLYTQSLEHEDLKGPHPAFYHLIHLYILADQLGVSLLKNKIVETVGWVSDRTNACPAPADTKLLDAKTTMGSNLRTLVLDLFVWKTTDKLLLEHQDDW